jgi:uncharacterized protein YaaW (UPF0174 family)
MAGCTSESIGLVAVGRRSFFRVSAASIAAAWVTDCWAWDTDSKDTNSAEFVQFLNNCTPEERVQLGQSLQIYPSLNKEDFGKHGLDSYDTFVDNATEATPARPMRPATFNDVPPEVVTAAVRAGRLEADTTATYSILSNLLWRYNNIGRYPFTDRDQINYHEIVQWVARKKGVKEHVIPLLSTFMLEQEIHKKFLEGIWDRLTVEQRTQLLKEIEKQTNTTIADKAAIAAMGGGAAIAALGASVAMSGFAFYTTMSVVICTVAGWLGLTLPFWVYMGASSTVALLSGPIGWAIAALSVLGGLTWLVGMPNVDRTAAFVMTMNVIKANKLKAAGTLD